MSPNEIAKGVGIPIITTLLTGYAFFLLNTNDMDAREINAKIETKISRSEVVEMIKQVEEKRQIEKEYLFKILDRIDKRTEKIEDKLMR